MGNFLSEIAQLGIERIVTRQIDFFPDRLIQFFLGKNLLWMRQLGLKNLKFFFAQAKRLFSRLQFKSFWVQDQIFKGQLFR